jgi:C-terminal processing protease CtpA/Prc
MRDSIARLRGRSRSTAALAPLLLAVALVGTGPAGAETAAEIEARMAETEAQIEQRGAEMEVIAEEIETHAMAARSRDQEIELRLEEAQRELEEAAREVAELSARLSGDAIELAIRSLGARRVMLGINIGPEPADGGVRVMGVTPGGPAERAGIRSGDVITTIDGVDLTGGGPGEGMERLSARMENVAAGDELTLTVRRGDADIDFLVTPEELAPMVMAFGTDGEGLHLDLGDLEELEALKNLEIHGDHAGGFAFSFGSAGRWGDMELVTLTPDLGQYFDAEAGLLVVRAPGDATLGLRDGDVILGIDGRTPTDPGHAMRILRSYESGERLRLDIIRERQRQELEILVPAADTDGASSLERQRSDRFAGDRPA